MQNKNVLKILEYCPIIKETKKSSRTFVLMMIG